MKFGTASGKSVVVVLLALAFCITAGADGGDNPTPGVYAVRDAHFSQPLNGDWSFKYVPALDPGSDGGFHEPGFDAARWKTIPVPANWELKGFAEPCYGGHSTDGLGLYRRTFRVPDAWRGGRRVCLRFEGVAFGFEAWVNGKKIGASSASAFNPHTFDITDALNPNPGADEVLAVQVSTKPFAYEFDINDDWALSGIYRDVTLFSVPATHVQDITTRTKLAADGSAELSVAVAASQADGEISGKLISPDGQTAIEFNLPQKVGGAYEAMVKVAQPNLWTAETPELYRLQLTLSVKGQPQQAIEQRIGLREVSIVDGVLLLNGRPIKLRGVDHHDLDPIDGRAITEPEIRRDLDLMRKANINFIRTSHYAPQPQMIELCDELGFYVMCEVAIGKGEDHLPDPAYRANIMARTDATITRDKNSASVIIWSIGNENPVTDVERDAGRRAKELDPSRPICFPKIPSAYLKSFEKDANYADIGSPHYPSNAALREFAKKSTHPLILTEYAHAWGLATDHIQDQWDFMQKTPRCAGGAIWHFMDQGILRTSALPVDTRKPTMDAWLDPSRYYDCYKGAGTDGLVYADRTPQADFWETRKVYSPVQVAERSIVIKPGDQELDLHIENRFDFISLAGMKLSWSLKRNNVELQHGELPLSANAHDTQAVRVPISIPAGGEEDVLQLDLRCTDAKGSDIIDRTVRLDLAGARRSEWINTLPVAGDMKMTQNDSEIRVENRLWILTVIRATGALTISDGTGRLLVNGIYPHCGHKFTMTEQLLAKKMGTWPSGMLTKVVAPEVTVTQKDSTVHVSVSGRYPRSDDEKQSFVGGYSADIAPNGSIAIHYDYAPTDAKGELTEAGLSIALPAAMTEFRWIGQGIDAGYPGKDRLNEFGLFHLNRADLRFQGNRRETELALLTTESGRGIALSATAADVAVERDGETTRLSHNAVISSLGNKAWLPETVAESAKIQHIKGSFTLVPLEDTWPTPISRWFGKPAAAKDVFHPFYYSYDQ